MERRLGMLGVGFAFCAAVCYGASTLFISRSVAHARPMAVALVTLIAGLVLVGSVTVIVRLLDPSRATVSTDGAPWVVAAALLMLVVGRVTYYSSIEAIGPSRSAALSATTTLAAPLFALLVLGDRLSLVTAAGVLATFLGIFLLITGRKA